MGVFQTGFGLDWEIIIFFFWYGQTQGKGTVPADHTRTWLFY